MNEYISKALVGFDGQCFYEGYYGKESYLIIIHEKEVTLLSNEDIGKKSIKYRDGFKTKLSFQELEDIVQCKMYAIYKGNEYRVQMVAPRLKTVELLMREGFEKEDYTLGFEDNIHERITYKIVSINEIEELRVEKKSIYNDLV